MLGGYSFYCSLVVESFLYASVIDVVSLQFCRLNHIESMSLSLLPICCFAHLVATKLNPYTICDNACMQNENYLFLCSCVFSLCLIYWIISCPKSLLISMAFSGSKFLY